MARLIRDITRSTHAPMGVSVAGRFELVTCVSLVIAFWPVWLWYGARMTDGSDEPWGLLSLAVTGVFLWRERRGLTLTMGRCLAASVLVAGYTLTYGVLPPLCRAMIAVAASGVMLIPARGGVGVLALLFLSLPLLASIQFYCGYPLRWLTASGSALLLRLGNIKVEASGVVLHWRGEMIAVDAPCSGVNMLWGALFLSAVLAAWLRLSFLRSAIIGSLAVCMVMAANVVRSAALFFKETGLVTLPDWTHAGIGIFIFTMSAIAIAQVSQRLSHVTSPHPAN